MAPKQAYVCIVDDDLDTRQSLTTLIESHGLSVKSFSSAEVFLEHCLARFGSLSTEQKDPSMGGEWPACLVCDLRLPGMSGIALQEEIDRRGYYIPVILVSAYGNTQIAVRAMERGAVTFLEKPWSNARLWNVVQRAIGQSAELRRIAEMRRRLSTLTDSEGLVLDYALAGMTNKAMEKKMGISLRTVELRRSSIRRKVGVDSFAELIRLTVEAKHPWRGPHRRSFDAQEAAHEAAEIRKSVD